MPTDKRGHIKDSGCDDRHLRVHKQHTRMYSVLSAGMAVPLGSNKRGGDIVIHFGYSHDSTSIDELFGRVSNIFRQHNRISQLVYVASQLTKVILNAGLTF